MCVEFVLFVSNLGALVRATVGRHSVEPATRSTTQMPETPEFGGRVTEEYSSREPTKVKES